MKIRKILIGTIASIIIISILFMINDYRDNIQSTENRVKKIEQLDRKFDNEVKQQNKLNEIEENNKENKPIDNVNLELENVIGRIKIDKLSLDYPILEGSNEENLNITITRFYGSKINDIGNCVLAGHNMKDGTLFGNLFKLKKNDNIILIDNLGRLQEYKIFNIKIVEPTDLTVLEQVNYKMVTLITCTDDGKRRLILQAKEI